MLFSNYRPLVRVNLPTPRDRQHYMHTFPLESPTVPTGFEDYLQVVSELCQAAGATKGMAHITFDEKVVKAGSSQRRPKPHVDGCFMPARGYWGHGGWTHPSPGWLHTCNNIELPELRRMPVIVVASVPGCRVWTGTFEGIPADDGDLSHLELGEGEVLPANQGFLLSADCVHESMLMTQDTPRTFLRIALPNNIDYGV